MKLENVLDQVDRMNDDAVIFAKKPWTLASDAEVGLLDADLRVPKTMADRRLEYFLEASVAKEVLEVFGDRKPTIDQRRALLMYYAEYDAYPDWVYAE